MLGSAEKKQPTLLHETVDSSPMEFGRSTEDELVFVPMYFQKKWPDRHGTIHLTVVVNLPSGVSETEIEDYKVVDSGNTLKLALKWPECMCNADILFSQELKNPKIKDRKRREHTAISDALIEMRESDVKPIVSVARIPLDFEVTSVIKEIAAMAHKNGTKALIFTLSAPQSAFNGFKIGKFKSMV